MAWNESENAFVVGSGIGLEWNDDGSITFVVNQIGLEHHQEDESHNRRWTIQPGQRDPMIAWLIEKDMESGKPLDREWIESTARRVVNESNEDELWLRNLEMMLKKCRKWLPKDKQRVVSDFVVRCMPQRRKIASFFRDMSRGVKP